MQMPNPGEVWWFKPYGWMVTILEDGGPETGLPYRRVAFTGGEGQGHLGVDTLAEGLAEKVMHVNGQRFSAHQHYL